MPAALVIYILLLAFSVIAQQSSKAVFMGVAMGNPVSIWSPTNEPYGSGTNIISWYLWSDYYTNGTILTVPDRSGVHTYHLTNVLNKATWPITNASGLVFDGTDDRLMSQTYTSAQPHEVVMVYAMLDASNSTYKPYLDSYSTTVLHRNELYRDTDNKEYWYAGTAIAFATVATNFWQVMDMIYDSTRSRVYTNGVLAVIGSAGVGVCDGLLLGANASQGTFGGMAIKEIVTYSATNSILSRSNMYYYYKTIRGYPVP